tara:strand:+ start:13693 stop:14190 length:498 start_codon:yes stop_codon:yes gene_type:complete
MTLLLGIDPGSHNTGYGLIDKGDDIRCVDFGVIVANPDWPFEKRLAFMGEELDRVLTSYQPNIVVTEDVFTAKNIKSSLHLAHIRGVVLYKAYMAGAEIHHYAAKAVKKGVTGNGNASKDQVALLLQNILNTQIHVNKLDATDALALAYYHASKMDILRRFGAQV